MEETKNKKEEIKYIVNDKVKSDITMTFTDNVLVAISTACSISSTKEWSAIIFYKVKNLDKGFKSININVFDMLVMDIGTGINTSWEYNDDVNSYMIDKDILGNDVCMGQLHSHVGMEAFFSGEDMATLKQEAIDREHNLSVVVNNRGDVVAKISRKLVRKVKGIMEISYPTFNEKIVSEKVAIDNIDNIIEFYDVKYIKNIDKSVVDRMKALSLRSRASASNREGFKRDKEKYNVENYQKDLFGNKTLGNSDFTTSNIMSFMKKYIYELVLSKIIRKINSNSFSILDCDLAYRKDVMSELSEIYYDDKVLKYIYTKILSSYKTMFTSEKDAEIIEQINYYMNSLKESVSTFDILEFENDIKDLSKTKLPNLYNKKLFDFISASEAVYLYYMTNFSDTVMCKYLFKCCNIIVEK